MYEGTPFIAMELLDGTDLRSVLERCRVFDVAPAVDYVLQICEALAAAHAIGVIHRDIKPENLFVLGDGDEHDHLKVLDFGISKVALIGNGRSTHQALTRVAVGTPPYMSPEQVRASRDLDGRSDLWSVGCVLYELVTGTAPFDRESLMQACAAVLEEEPPPPRQLRPALPAALSDTIMRCLRKSPEARFADVAELADALGPFGSDRFAGYPARCRAYLNGEGLGRRSTPSSLTAVRLNTSTHVTLSGSGPINTGAKPQKLAVRLDSSPIPASDRRSQPDGQLPALSLSQSPVSQIRAIPGPAYEEPVATSHLAAATHSTGRLIAWSAFTSLVLGGAFAGYLVLRERPARLLPLPREPVSASALTHADVAPPSAASDAPMALTPQVEAPPSAASTPLPTDGLLAVDKAAAVKPSSARTRSKPAARPLGDVKAKPDRAAASEDPDVGF
jgi:serine/threonine-protein kinase